MKLSKTTRILIEKIRGHRPGFNVTQPEFHERNHCKEVCISLMKNTIAQGNVQR